MSGNLFTDRRVILAPMAGVGDEVFRQLCIEQGAQLTYTEMVSAKALSYANEKTAHLLDLAPNEDRFRFSFSDMSRRQWPSKRNGCRIPSEAVCLPLTLIWVVLLEKLLVKVMDLP